MAQVVEAAPKFDVAVDAVGKNTLGLLPLWMQNWASNLQLARAGDSLDKLYQRPPVDRVLVVGRGPSIRKHGHLELLQKHPFPGHIIASDGALPLLVERNIVPYVSMTVDGSELIAKWFDGPTARLGGKVNAILPITVHPKTVAQARRVGAHIYWYIPEMDQEPLKGLTDTLQLQTLSKANPTGVSRANGAGNCGLASIVIATTILRAKEIVLVGMDNGYPPDTPITELHYHTGMMKSLGYDDQEVAKLYKVYWHPALGHTVVDPVFEVYRRTFVRLAELELKAGIKVVNCTEGGCLVADGVELLPFKDYLERASLAR